MTPLRCYAIHDEEMQPHWWVTMDKRTFERTTGDRLRVPADQLTMIGHGLNDQQLRKVVRRAISV